MTLWHCTTAFSMGGKARDLPDGVEVVGRSMEAEWDT